ncbi:NEDD8 ultimate buster 1 [Amborella trichopoda]|uniref:UBA domain-containing protein n=1 Tax=Amborella trichopoda TaxID=13333 RepID=U5CWF7_AMBTC|nr:NEDD8 ultimate buster 1 [Amborella trichopoda]XP_020528206.1 NEDD8 ultimate buster 1 [Amborella trichopoda]ERN14290.1 hypothetical protein AMTR_s00033p00177630 [Amborella trichopoda]|eukprot:XP_006852823.1 NEDD8 ultimate buster 1 [Amborella trichopoda]
METETSPKKEEQCKIRIGGAWSGVLEVKLEEWTLPMLKEEIGKRSNCSANRLNLIFSGKVLKDAVGDKKLVDFSLKNNSKILASRTSPDSGNTLNAFMAEEEERSRRLNRVRDAAVAMASRHSSGSLPLEDFNIELEDQSGQRINLGSETDQRAVMTGLMLHSNAKTLIQKGQYKDALDILMMGEEAFSLCDPKLIEMIDNVPILQIDMVWCYFMLRDISWLSMAGLRLEKAREGLERSHGKNSNRVRLIQAGLRPELPIYLRLDLLEGVVAYHSGRFEQATKALTSAQASYQLLQVPDEALSLLMSMGYKENAARRAMRMSGQNVQQAIDFLIEESERKQHQKEENMIRKKELTEQRNYGMTPLKKVVNLSRLDSLVSIGFERVLAAEALRRNENDTQKALDDLTNPETNSIIQLYIESRKRKRATQAMETNINGLVSMGFDRSRVTEALNQASTKEEALSILLSESPVGSNLTESPSVLYTNEATTSMSEPTSSTNEAAQIIRDNEMEEELVQELTSDPFADYDIDVTKEGEAVAEYVALLNSTQGASVTTK